MSPFLSRYETYCVSFAQLTTTVSIWSNVGRSKVWAYEKSGSWWDEHVVFVPCLQPSYWPLGPFQCSVCMSRRIFFFTLDVCKIWWVCWPCLANQIGAQSCGSLALFPNRSYCWGSVANKYKYYNFNWVFCPDNKPALFQRWSCCLGLSSPEMLLTAQKLTKIPLLW